MKEGRKTPETVANWLFAQTTPRRRIKIKLCMVGGLRCVVIRVKCDPNRSRGYGAVGVENGPFLLLWPVVYTTACTTVQAVISILHRSRPRNRLVDKITARTNCGLERVIQTERQTVGRICHNNIALCVNCIFTRDNNVKTARFP